MKGESLVSVIIPTYNRANLLVETLGSIMAQNYQKWECIVVDDGSNDKTQEILKIILEKEERIKYFHRPENLPKGANVCRNYGYNKSKGEYVIWFDSDDLMTSDHIAKKVRQVQKTNSDFVVAQTANFREGQLLDPYIYEKKEYGIRASDFILLKIHWYTYDIMLKREIAEQISWNEKMKSWQDYNYFCKMLLTTEKGTYLDEVLTHRRLHSVSIQQSLTENSKRFQSELLENRFLTFRDIENQINWMTKKELIYGMMNLCYDLAGVNSVPKRSKSVLKIVKKELGNKSAGFFCTAIMASYFFNKGYSILEKAKNRHS